MAYLKNVKPFTWRKREIIGSTQLNAARGHGGVQCAEYPEENSMWGY